MRKQKGEFSYSITGIDGKGIFSGSAMLKKGNSGRGSIDEVAGITGSEREVAARIAKWRRKIYKTWEANE